MAPLVLACPDASSAARLQQRLDALLPGQFQAVERTQADAAIVVCSRIDQATGNQAANALCIHEGVFAQETVPVPVRDTDVLNKDRVPLNNIVRELAKYTTLFAFQLSGPTFSSNDGVTLSEAHALTLFPHLFRFQDHCVRVNDLFADSIEAHDFADMIGANFDHLDPCKMYKLSASTASLLRDMLISRTAEWPLSRSQLLCRDFQCRHATRQERAGERGLCRYILADKGGERAFYHDHRSAEVSDVNVFYLHRSLGKFTVPQARCCSNAARFFKRRAAAAEARLHPGPAAGSRANAKRQRQAEEMLLENVKRQRQAQETLLETGAACLAVLQQECIESGALLSALEKACETKKGEIRVVLTDLHALRQLKEAQEKYMKRGWWVNAWSWLSGCFKQ